MRTTAIVLLLAGALLDPVRADAKPPPCAEGRFLVPDVPLLNESGAPLPDVVGLAGRMLSVRSGCDPVKARVRATAKGTRIRARWKSCAGLGGKAVLSGWIMEDCQRLAATFTARSAGIVKPFVAYASHCGDDVWDPEGGEHCDAGLGACSTALCTSCICPGMATTTTSVTGTTGPGGTSSTSTTSVGATSSTSTMPALPTTSTTSTTLAGPDLAPVGWMSPPSAPSGSNIAVQFSVKNFGTTTAVASWYDYVLLSTDYAIGNDTAVAVVQRMTNLSAGTQYTVLAPQVPMNVPPGTYYLFLHTDGSNAVGETQENNNLGGLIQIIITP